MRGVYTVEAHVTGVNAIQTLMMLEVPSDMVVEIISVSATVTNSPSASEIQLEFGRITAKGSAAGTSETPEKMEQGDVASTVTCTSDLTTEPTTYYETNYDHQGVPNNVGYFFTPMPEERPVISPSGIVGLLVAAAPSPSVDFAVAIRYREIGG
jgi:hypothetical protein